MEILEFRFPAALRDYDKEAFIHYSQQFQRLVARAGPWLSRRETNDNRTMFAPTSGADEESVINPSRLLWLGRGPHNADSDIICVVLLTWDGPAQQQQWLNNFLTHGYTVLGHVAHILGLACPDVESKHVFLRLPPSRERSTGGQDDDDLGF